MAHPTKRRPPSTTGGDYADEVGLLGSDLAPLAAGSLEAAIHLCRVRWEAKPDDEKWGFALAASAYLRKRARWFGSGEAALMAVTLIEQSCRFAPDDLEKHNQLGLALQSLGELNDSPKVLERAISAYRQAIEAAGSSGAPIVSRLRFQLNLAAAWHSIGERTNAETSRRLWRSRLRASLRILFAVRREESFLFAEDRCRVMETLGNALTCIEYRKASLRAFISGQKLLPSASLYPDEHIRFTRNLGTAYLLNRSYRESAAAFRLAIDMLSRDQSPFIWSLTQSKYGYALLGLSSLEPQDVTQSLKESAEAFTEALATCSKVEHPAIWGQAAFGFGVALKTLGNRQLGARESIENQLDGLAHLIRASRLLGDFPEYLTSYIKDAQAAYSELTDEIHRFVTNLDIKYGMASNIEYKARVLALLDELGVSPHDRATILSGIVSEVAAAAQRLPSEILQRSPNTKPPSGRPADKSAPDASMPAEARALFGDPPPPVSRPAKYTKSTFPLDWLDNQNIVRAARRVTTEYKARDKSIPVPLDEAERVRAAFRLVRAYERRQQRMRAQPQLDVPKPT